MVEHDFHLFFGAAKSEKSEKERECCGWGFGRSDASAFHYRVLMVRVRVT